MQGGEGGEGGCWVAGARGASAQGPTRWGAMVQGAQGVQAGVQAGAQGVQGVQAEAAQGVQTCRSAPGSFAVSRSSSNCAGQICMSASMSGIGFE